LSKNNKVDIQGLTIDGFTTPTPITVGIGTAISEIIVLMEDNEIRHLPVVDANNLAVGIITDRDVATVKSFGFNQDILAKDLMSPDPIHVNEHASLVDCVYLMSSKKLGSLIVTNTKEEVTGIFTNTDALNSLIEILRGEILEEDL
jgi:CBS domain-containing protein